MRNLLFASAEPRFTASNPLTTQLEVNYNYIVLSALGLNNCYVDKHGLNPIVSKVVLTDVPKSPPLCVAPLNLFHPNQTDIKDRAFFMPFSKTNSLS